MNLELLSWQLKEGDISISEWQAEMREYLRLQYEQAMILAKGGREFVTQSDWGYEGSLLKKQYQYLDGFAQDIANNPDKWLTGNNMLNRMNLYKDSAYTALEDFQQRKFEQLGFTEEKNDLGDADHCDDCLQETSRGWVSIGELVPIGDRQCQVRCKCTMRYRRLEPNGSYTYA